MMVPANELIPAITSLNGIDRDIALEIHGQEFAQYGDRVSQAFEKALESPKYGRFQALDREVRKAEEEEDFFLLVMSL
jgi:hypothetical protein